MSSNEEFEPHGIYMWLGFDKKRNVIAFRSDLKGPVDIERVKESIKKSLETLGWVYCIDCKTPLFDLETAMEHLKRGHVLATRFMPDDVAREEVRSVS